MNTASITYSNNHQPIPVDKGVPVLGCLPEMAKDPLSFFRRLTNQYNDCVEFKFPFLNMALVTAPELCHQILVKENGRFRKADRDMKIMSALLGNGLVTNNQHASHKAHRKLVQPGFHFRRIEGYAQTMIEYTDQYLADWPEQGERNVADDMFRLTMYIVSKTLFDIDMNHLSPESKEVGEAMHAFQVIADKRFDQMFQHPDWLPTPNNLKMKQIRKTLDNTIRQMIETRRSEEGDMADKGDLMSLLLEARYEDGSSMSSQQVMDELLTLFVAGHETTSNALTWTLYLLATHPEIQTRLQQELDLALAGDTPAFEDLEALKYTEMVVKESMRILPPVWTINCRQANEDIDLGDYVIPKDKVVFISPYANHFNERYFPDPDRFDPERFTEENEKKLPRFAYIPFGGGPRVCIGNSFAMMEAKLILATLVKRYRFELAPGQKIEPQSQVTLSNKGGMRLRFQKR